MVLVPKKSSALINCDCLGNGFSPALDAALGAFGVIFLKASIIDGLCSSLSGMGGSKMFLVGMSLIAVHILQWQSDIELFENSKVEMS